MSQAMNVIDHRPRVAAQRRERMRVRLLDAALALVAREGQGAVTIDAVIAQAGVARGTFYKYFDAPASLLEALAMEVSDALIRAMHPFMSLLEDPAERACIGIRTVLRLVRRYPSLGAFLARSGWPAVAGSHALFSLVGADLQAGMSRGRLQQMPIELALSVLAGTMVGAMHAVTSAAQVEDFPEQTAAAVLRALGLSAQDAHALANAPLAMPEIDSETLVGQLMMGLDDGVK